VDVGQLVLTFGGLLFHCDGGFVVWPVAGLVIVALLVAERQRWHYLILLIVVIFLVPFITDALMWGSFPFIFDDAGVARLRMKAYASVSGSVISGGTASGNGLEQITNTCRFGRLP